MKHWKEGFFLLPAVGLVSAAAAGFYLNAPELSKITYPTKTVEAAEEKAKGNYTDGIYQGTGTGFKGDVTVEVQVTDHQIASIEVLSYVDDKAFFERAKKLTKTMIEEQTWEVDAVSGATYSSRGIKEAVRNALTGSTEKSELESAESAGKLTETLYQGGSWADGVYRGSAMGYGGTITVEVTISGGSIADIQVVDHAKETPSYFEKALAIVSRIVEAQSPNVDTVSGATYSSNGIREAVIVALNQAAGAAVDTTDTAADPSVSETDEDREAPEGLPADGTYTGSAVCEQFGYTLSLKARFQDGKTVSLNGPKITGNEDEANEEYWVKAWKPMVKRILKAQNTEVDAVSGATYSSNAIVDAYLDAYKKAVAANGGKTDDDKNDTKKDTEEKTPDIMEDEEEKPSGTVTDGTYRVSALCEPDAKKAFLPYTMTADVIFADGKLKSMTNFTSTDETNRNYYLRAANGTEKYSGVVPQLVKKQSASGISAVSGATCSSKTIRSLYLLALTEATGTAQDEPEEDMEKDEEKPAEEEVPVGDVKDGTYTVTVTVKDIYDEFWDYDLTADVTFQDQKLVSIENMTLTDESNRGYCEEAAKTIIPQLLSRQSSNVDNVSGATCSSDALVELYKKAVEEAKK